MEYVAKKTGMEKEEIKKRIYRMYHEHLLMFVTNSVVSVCGFGLYYWIVKMKEDASPEIKEKLSEWFQNNDNVCTGYETSGDFDFFNGNHMRVLDNLLSEVIDPFKHLPEVDYVHLCPVRRDIRESNINLFDAPGDGFRKYIWGEDQIKRLMEIQDKIDEKDFAIVSTINNTDSVANMFDYDVLEKLSGLDAKELKKGFEEVVMKRRMFVPALFLNQMKLGLNIKFYLVRIFQIVPSYRKAQITNDFAAMPEFSNVFEFTDSFYDIMLGAYTELTDEEELLNRIESYDEVESVKIADSHKQFRRWTDRLDGESGFWEESVMTDDFLQNWTSPPREQLNFTEDKDSGEVK